MNQKLTNEQLTGACRELLFRCPTLSCRRLRLLLRERFGCSCRTDRVYALWRSIRVELERHPPEAAEPSTLEMELIEARKQITQLETAVFDADQRALRSEERERIHQDRWANEMYALREELGRLRFGGRKETA